MSVAFVLGNGVSRKEVDLPTLKTHGKIYGCNALYRDFVPDVLVATDTPISEAIQNSGYSMKHCFYTRRPLAGVGALSIPEEFWGYSSGPAAARIAAEDGNLLIYLLGFDLGPSESGKFNNVYADTEFYKKSNAVPTYTGNWVNQLTETSKKFKQVQFVRVVGPTTSAIKNLENLPNLLHLPILEFKKTYK